MISPVPVESSRIVPPSVYDWSSPYRNKMLDRHYIGVNVYGNLIAAANDDRKMQMINVKQYLRLSTGIKNFVSSIQSVKFVVEQIFGGELKLLMDTESRIDRWACESPK